MVEHDTVEHDTVEHDTVEEECAKVETILCNSDSHDDTYPYSCCFESNEPMFVEVVSDEEKKKEIIIKNGRECFYMKKIQKLEIK